MGPALLLPRLVFGSGTLASLDSELELLGVSHALLITDPGIANAGLAKVVRTASDRVTAEFADVRENPAVDCADSALAAYRETGCDGIVAVGGGSSIDVAKVVAATACTTLQSTRELIGQPANLPPASAPLVAIPTTVGTGSESSPVAALHPYEGGPMVGIRGPQMVPRVALCDPDLARSLPPHLVAATGIDALSHCIEGFFAEPANPVIDALALDGARRVFSNIAAAIDAGQDEARASLMAAAFAGGAAIHKGLGPAHAVAMACSDQPVHHGTMVGVALPHTTEMLAAALPAKAARLADALGLASGAELGVSITRLLRSLELPTDLRAAQYAVGDESSLVEAMQTSHFNRSSPYVPSKDEYAAVLARIA